MTVTTVPQTDGLKQKVVQSGTAKLFGQAANFVLRLAFLTIMARLLSPEEFGLFAMVTVVTGFYGLFTSAGLSSATIQRVTVTDVQISTLFWVNMLIGAVLCALCLATAPALVAFFHEPRLMWVTAAMAVGFLVNAAGVQHIALLQRDLRYVTLTSIEVLAQVASMATGIALAVAGFGLWALVASTLAGPGVMTVLAWITTGWIPGRPHRDAEILSMLRFGGVVTIQVVLHYAAQNIDKVLLGRFRGADTLGIYGRAYQLVAMPMTNLSAAVGWVAFSALSRIQDDPRRYRSYFLKGYGVVVSLVVPILVFATVFADDIVRVVLGAQWTDVSLIFQLLAPAALVPDSHRGPHVLAAPFARDGGAFPPDHVCTHRCDSRCLHCWHTPRCHRHRIGVLDRAVALAGAMPRVVRAWNAGAPERSAPHDLGPASWQCRRVSGCFRNRERLLSTAGTALARRSPDVLRVLRDRVVHIPAEGLLSWLGEGPETDFERELDVLAPRKQFRLRLAGARGKSAQNRQSLTVVAIKELGPPHSQWMWRQISTMRSLELHIMYWIRPARQQFALARVILGPPGYLPVRVWRRPGSPRPHGPGQPSVRQANWLRSPGVRSGR